MAPHSAAPRIQGDDAWRQLLYAFVDKSINDWRRRLECMIHQNGGNTENLFK